MSRPSTDDAHDAPHDPDPALFVQAYEADVVRGPQAWAAEGEGVIHWDGDGSSVDRYDARLLLDALPSFPAAPPSPTPSDSGWSSLPSDAEDTFFLAPPQSASYHAAKRRRILDSARLHRLRALGSPSPPPPDHAPTYPPSEPPTAPQLTLMRRTAAHLAASPNPAHLEMRILANHGADQRFAFLRGRWADAWAEVTRGAAVGQAEAESNGMGALVGYASGSDEGEGAPTDNVSVAEHDDARRAARRAKARQWAARRRAAKEGRVAEGDGEKAC